MEKHNICIIGGGAAGMMAAIIASEKEQDVCILEADHQLGKKLLRTGNGRCNYTNENLDSSMYGDKYETDIAGVLSRFSLVDTLLFFQTLGIDPISMNGYYYPRSLQAKSIRDVMERKIQKQRIKVHLETKINTVYKENDKFILESTNGSFGANKLILACGGLSQPSEGADGIGYQIARELGHHIEEPIPSLTGLISADKGITKASGIRIDARLNAFVFQNEIYSECGNLQITDYGISGIVTFNLSLFLARSIAQGRECCVDVDFLPEIDDPELYYILEQRFRGTIADTIEDCFVGMLPDKLIPVILEAASIPLGSPVNNLTAEHISQLVFSMKAYRIPIKALKGFEHAQTTDGGVLLSEINTSSFESLICPGLYFAGEMLDVSGLCGGYNLQWAWSSGYHAACGATNDL